MSNYYEILCYVMTHKAQSMKHSIITHTYINLGLGMPKSECLNDTWNFYESNLDDLRLYCKLCGFHDNTDNEFYNILYRGFAESKIIINNYYNKERK